MPKVYSAPLGQLEPKVTKVFRVSQGRKVFKVFRALLDRRELRAI